MLAQGGKLVGEQVFTDVYWDAEGCGLTERDWWLRRRAGRWELKVRREYVHVGCSSPRDCLFDIDVRGGHLVPPFFGGTELDERERFPPGNFPSSVSSGCGPSSVVLNVAGASR